MKHSGRKYDIALMTNELSAHAEHSLTPVEFSTLADGIRAELDEITSEYVTHPDGIGAANSGKVLTEDATDVNSGDSITFPSSDPGPDQARKSVKAALVLDRPQEASERYANLCLLATELAGLSTADRVQHPSYRGEQQNGEHFSDIRLTHEGKEYVALKPYSSSHRKAFEDRIAGLSWEGIDTPPPGVELGVTYTDTVGEEMIICNPAAGKPTYRLTTEEIQAIPDSHLESMTKVAEYHANRGNMIDCVGNNFFYDPEIGFTVIDCEPVPEDDQYDAEMIFSDFILGVAGYEDILKYYPVTDRLLAMETFRARAKAIQQNYWKNNVVPKEK